MQPERIEYKNGRIEYRLFSALHREDGPAWIDPDGSKGWYLNGKRIEPTLEHFSFETLFKYDILSSTEIAQYRIENKK